MRHRWMVHIFCMFLLFASSGKTDPLVTEQSTKSADTTSQHAEILAACEKVKRCERTNAGIQREPITGLTWKCYQLSAAALCVAAIETSRVATAIETSRVFGGIPYGVNYAQIIERLRDWDKHDPRCKKR